MKLVVDIVIRVERSKALLIKRAKAPFQDKLVLPGGHVEEADASIVRAVAREALEEVGLRINPSRLSFLMALDAPNRDPRPERRISMVYLIDLASEDELRDCKAASDAASLHLRDLNSITPDEMGFDHWKVIEALQ